MKRLAAVLAAGLASFAPAGAEDWPIYGGGAENIRYSPLAQIHRGNVKKLRVAWTYDTGDAYQGSELQCSPIVVNGVLYGTTPRLRVFALDAAAGKPLWTFDPNPGVQTNRKNRNRGVTWWESGDDRRIYFAERHWLHALDARTGKPVASFGENGKVDLRVGLGRPVEEVSITATTPGIVYRDLLIMGSLVPEGLPAAPGDIRAYDARTGKIRWTFHTIPRPGEFGHETWPKDAWIWAGGANNWPGLALDERRGLVFASTGSASFDFYGANRAGDNLFANSVLALKAATGERVWHFQAVRHDVWDRDFPSPPALVTVRHGGRSIDAVAQTTKSGHVYLFERETGKPLFPVEYRKVSTAGVEGEPLADTQPLPVKPEPFARQKLTEDMLTRRTPEAHRAVLERFRTLRSNGQWEPPSREGTIVFPGFDGGAEWGGASFDASSGLLYVNSNEMPWVLRLIEKPLPGKVSGGKALYQANCAACHRPDLKGTPPEFPALTGLAGKRAESDVLAVIRRGAGRMPGFARLGDAAVGAIAAFILTGADKPVSAGAKPRPIDQKFTHDGYNKFLDPDGYPAITPPWGTLNAINLNTGDYAWKIPFGEFPELAAKGLRNTGSENYGGPVATGGGLLFIGATNHDRKFHAFDKATGELLWEATLPAAGNATPAVYSVKGRQYVAIAAGGGKSGAPSGGSYVAFALPEE